MMSIKSSVHKILIAEGWEHGGSERYCGDDMEYNNYTKSAYGIRLRSCGNTFMARTLYRCGVPIGSYNSIHELLDAQRDFDSQWRKETGLAPVTD